MPFAPIANFNTLGFLAAKRAAVNPASRIKLAKRKFLINSAAKARAALIMLIVQYHSLDFGEYSYSGADQETEVLFFSVSIVIFILIPEAIAPRSECLLKCPRFRLLDEKVRRKFQDTAGAEKTRLQARRVLLRI